MEKISSLQDEFRLGEYLIRKVDGFWFLPKDIPGIEEAVNNFKPLPTDVILVSFPKTGTTWLKTLIFSIIHRSSFKQYLDENHPHELIPHLEFQVYGPSSGSYSSPLNYRIPGTDPSFSPPRRIISTHIPHQLLARSLDSSDCKVVYVTRNPKDTIISAWHFVNKSKVLEGREPWSLQNIVDGFCGGVIPFGPYYDHALGYKKVSLERPNKIFFITYEELKNDTKSHVKRLAEFLGCPVDKEEELEEIVKTCSIETLKTHPVNQSNEVPSWFPILTYSSYFRKGQVGDYQNYMNKEMIDLVDTTTLANFGGLSYDEVTKGTGSSNGN